MEIKVDRQGARRPKPTGRPIALNGVSDYWNFNGDSLPERTTQKGDSETLNPLLERPATSLESNVCWYALHVRSRKESYIASQIQGQGYECLLPTYKSIRNWSDRVKELEQPLFPGYLFCRFDFQSRRQVVTTPGVLQIVGYGRTAIPVSNEEIQALQLAVSSGIAKQPWPYLEVGQRVRVNYGTLTGLEGVLVNVKGNHRVVVSVTLLQRSVAMEVETSWLSPIRETTQENAAQRMLQPVRVSLGS